MKSSTVSTALPGVRRGVPMEETPHVDAVTTFRVAVSPSNSPGCTWSGSQGPLLRGESCSVARLGMANGGLQVVGDVDSTMWMLRPSECRRPLHTIEQAFGDAGRALRGVAP